MTRILVIEDEAFVRENIVELLRAEGYDVLFANDGEEGVRLARNVQPDLILCDIRMPHLDGYGVLAKLSNDRLTETIPFIFITARTERSDQRMGMVLGADDYVTKPFTRKELLNSIRKRLEKKQVLLRQVEEKLDKLQRDISWKLPYNLLSPLSVLLGNAELLAESESIASDATQVRGIAKDMRRAATRLTHLVRNYMLYLELDSAHADANRRAILLEGRLTVDEGEIVELLRGLARDMGREEDVCIDMDPAVLRMPEAVFFSLLEAMIDEGLRQSRLGNAIKILGKIRNSVYNMTVISTFSEDPAALLLASKVETSLNILLARRIAEFFGGELTVQDSMDGVSRIEITLPRVWPIE